MTPPPQPIVDTSKRTMLGVPSLRLPGHAAIPAPAPNGKQARGSVPAVPRVVDEPDYLPPMPATKGTEPGARVRLGTELGSGPVARVPAHLAAPARVAPPIRVEPPARIAPLPVETRQLAPNEVPVFSVDETRPPAVVETQAPAVAAQQPAPPVVARVPAASVPHGPAFIDETTEPTELQAQAPLPSDPPVLSRDAAAALLAPAPTIAPPAVASPAISPRARRGRLFLLALGPFALAAASAFATTWYFARARSDAPVASLSEPTTNAAAVETGPSDPVAQPRVQAEPSEVEPAVAVEAAAPVEATAAIAPVATAEPAGTAAAVEPAATAELAKLSQSELDALARVQYTTTPRELLAAATTAKLAVKQAAKPPTKQAASSPARPAAKKTAVKQTAKPTAKPGPKKAACTGLDCL